MDDAVTLPFSAAERELLAELDDARCTCGGGGPVHCCPPCAEQLIKRLHAEIVSLQVIAGEALNELKLVEAARVSIYEAKNDFPADQ